MAEFAEVPTDPSDRADVTRPAKTLAELEAAMNHTLDIYNALGVQWGTDPFTAIQELKDRAAEKPPRQLYDSIPLFGYELITRERIRQIAQEGWSEEHDNEHTDGSLAIVGAIYAVAGLEDVEVINVIGRERMLVGLPAWPTTWAEEYDKSGEHPRMRCLVIAGALIAAEIDRLQRWADANEKAEVQHIRESINADMASEL